MHICSLVVASPQLYAITTWQLQWVKTKIATGGIMRLICYVTSAIRAKLEFLKISRGTGTSSLCWTLSCLWSSLEYIQSVAVLSETHNELKRITRMVRTGWAKFVPDGITTGEFRVFYFLFLFFDQTLVSLELSAYNIYTLRDHEFE